MMEIFVKTDSNAKINGLLGMVKAAYHRYKKLIGAQEVGVLVLLSDVACPR